MTKVGTAYIACSFSPARRDLRLFWRGADGKPYQTFGALARDLKSKGKSLRFAMNGGMYQDDFQPVGLYVENGRELARANTATLTGAPSACRGSNTSVAAKPRPSNSVFAIHM